MKKALLMNFVVDKDNKKINVEREFNAPLDLVWSAWTESEILDQWWAPKPWQTRTKSMDFREGGCWIYAMVGPNGEEHYGRADYKSIAPQKGYLAVDGFCDREGNINKELPQNQWKTDFKKLENSTLVEIELTFKSLADLEQIIEMGFKEGFTAGLENLDQYLFSVQAS